MIQHFVWCCL